MTGTVKWTQSTDPRSDHQRVIVSKNGGPETDVSDSLGMTVSSFDFPVNEGDVIAVHILTCDADESDKSSDSATVSATAQVITPLLPATGLSLSFML